MKERYGLNVHVGQGSSKPSQSARSACHGEKTWWFFFLCILLWCWLRDYLWRGSRCITSCLTTMLSWFDIRTWWAVSSFVVVVAGIFLMRMCCTPPSVTTNSPSVVGKLTLWFGYVRVYLMVWTAFSIFLRSLFLLVLMRRSIDSRICLSLLLRSKWEWILEGGNAGVKG